MPLARFVDSSEVLTRFGTVASSLHQAADLHGHSEPTRRMRIFLWEIALYATAPHTRRVAKLVRANVCRACFGEDASLDGKGGVSALANLISEFVVPQRAVLLARSTQRDHEQQQRQQQHACDESM